MWSLFFPSLCVARPSSIQDYTDSVQLKDEMTYCDQTSFKSVQGNENFASIQDYRQSVKSPKTSGLQRMYMTHNDKLS